MNKNIQPASPSKPCVCNRTYLPLPIYFTIETDGDVEDEEGKNLKKPRITFTLWQSFELERSFRAKKYLSSNQNAELAFSLSVTERQGNHTFEPKNHCADKLIFSVEVEFLDAHLSASISSTYPCLSVGPSVRRSHFRISWPIRSLSLINFNQFI